MKIKENISIRKIGNDYMMLTDSDVGVDYTRVVSLNSSAAYLVTEVLSKEFTLKDWTDLLVKKYGIVPEKAQEDAQNLLATLEKAGVIVE